MVTIRIENGKDVFQRTLLFSDINSVLKLSNEFEDVYRLVRVDVLIPAYLHGGSGYKLAQLMEVWESDDCQVRSFVLADGSSILDAYCDAEQASRADFSLAARF